MRLINEISPFGIFCFIICFVQVSLLALKGSTEFLRESGCVGNPSKGDCMFNGINCSSDNPNNRIMINGIAYTNSTCGQPIHKCESSKNCCQTADIFKVVPVKNQKNLNYDVHAACSGRRMCEHSIPQVYAKQFQPIVSVGYKCIRDDAILRFCSRGVKSGKLVYLLFDRRERTHLTNNISTCSCRILQKPHSTVDLYSVDTRLHNYWDRESTRINDQHLECSKSSLYVDGMKDLTCDEQMFSPYTKMLSSTKMIKKTEVNLTNIFSWNRSNENPAMVWLAIQGTHTVKVICNQPDDFTEGTNQHLKILIYVFVGNVAIVLTVATCLAVYIHVLVKPRMSYVSTERNGEHPVPYTNTDITDIVNEHILIMEDVYFWHLQQNSEDIKTSN